jgi:DNA-binding MarR family transcriptional regulator
MEKTALVADIREFNRFYTGIIGLLDPYYLDSGYSLTEVRTLFELRSTPGCTAKDVISRLKIDPSYMSRILGKFRRAGLLERTRSEDDNRAKVIRLTERGQTLTDDLIRSSDRAIGKLIEDLSGKECREVRQAIKTLEKYLKDV